MKNFQPLAMVVVMLVGQAALADLPALTDYKSGISLTVEGELGRDYVFERFWHNAPEDDRGVIYIRSNAKITLAHNERNTAHTGTTAPWREIGIHGADGQPNSGDEGVIRYKVDRDQQVYLSWSDKVGRFHNPPATAPAYEGPIAFDALEYESGVPVVGTTGVKPGVEPGTELYYRGIVDEQGETWHTLTVADDDGAMHDAHYSHKWASDGKVYLFIVNPKTPALALATRTDDAQYYTTPAKTYFLPRIHRQISYVTDGVAIHLTNITNDQPIKYQWGDGPVTAYTGPVMSDDLTDGEHVLTYWFDEAAKRTRTFVKNPDYPSKGEKHGYLLWADDAERDAIAARLQRDPYQAHWQSVKTTWSRTADADRILGRGSRNWVTGALNNALVAHFEGVDTTVGNTERTYASYAKRKLLDNVLTIDPVGLELSHNFSPMPGAEWNHFGYYAVNPVYDLAFAYDLLITQYRADQVAGGITPIEDLRMRDLLARWVAVQLQELRGYEGGNPRQQGPSPDPGQGMWDWARLSGAAIIAMAMPGYHTHYYGTSGFDGTTKATHTDVPFANQAFTWREIFMDADQPVNRTPQLRRRFNHLDGGLITEEGFFHDRQGYYNYHLMGHCFMILANAAKNSTGKEWPYLEKSFERAIAGTMEGRKYSNENDRGPRRYVQFLLVNQRFPKVADAIYDYVKDQPGTNADGRRNDNAPGFLFYQSQPYGLLWYQDNWREALRE